MDAHHGHEQRDHRQRKLGHPDQCGASYNTIGDTLVPADGNSITIGDTVVPGDGNSISGNGVYQTDPINQDTNGIDDTAGITVGMGDAVNNGFTSANNSISGNAIGPNVGGAIYLDPSIAGVLPAPVVTSVSYDPVAMQTTITGSLDAVASAVRD